MPAASARATIAYQQTQVQSCNPLEQVVLLYDAVIQSLTKVIEAMERKDAPRRHRGISHALNILNYLQSTLNMEQGGEIAVRLDALYNYVRDLLLTANRTQDPAPVDEARQLINILREGWAQIAKNPPGPVAVDRGRV